jgi:tRNA (guanine26-N2/guanine27-N2)-dimethyltransferase
MKLDKIFEGGNEYVVPVPISSDSVPRKSDESFFNKNQELNRDISVLVLRNHIISKNKKGVSACEPFGGVGVRSCRYLLEAPVNKLFYNDANLQAIKVARNNFENIPTTFKSKISISNLDFTDFINDLYLKKQIMDFIDIDPYGSPISFVHSSLKLVTVSGLLAFTATDLASLTGLYPRALYSKYGIGVFDKRIGNVHELAIRTLITGIQRVGLIQKQSLLPVLTLYHRHFIRTFMVRMRGVDKVINDTGFLCQCQKCHLVFETVLKTKHSSCPSCGNGSYRIGPIFLGSIHDDTLLEDIADDIHINSFNRGIKIHRILNLMIEENKIKIPWSYDIQKLTKKTGTPIPSLNLVSDQLRDIGFKFSKTHFSGSCIKTDAPEKEICGILAKLIR